MESSRDVGQTGRKSNGALTVVLVLVIGARLALACLVYARPELAVANDSDRYIPIANAILNGTAYSWTTAHPGELLNTVGYPLFLAGVFATLGSGSGDIALAQLALSGLLALCLYLLFARRIGGKAAFLGALLLALDPLSALWSMTILTETMFACTLGLSAGFLAAWAYDQKVRVLFLAGVCAGLSCLVKPLALLIAGVWAVALVLFAGGNVQQQTTNLATRIRRAAIFLLPTILLAGPWFVRNGLLWDCVTLSSVDRVTLRDYMAAKVLAEANHVRLDEAQAQLQAADPGVCPDQAGRYWGIILANPAIYARLHAAGTVPLLIATNFDRWLQYFGESYTLPDLWRPFLDGGWRALGQVMRARAGQVATCDRPYGGIDRFPGDALHPRGRGLRLRLCDVPRAGTSGLSS